MTERSRTQAYVGLGSNLGDREAHLAFAIAELEALAGTEVTARSRLFESRAVGPGAQGPYLNAVVELATEFEPRALLAALQGIEQRAGRVRRERWGPRTLDLDLLLYGDCAIAEPDLVVPHPRMAERNFVMEPLAELAPDRRLGSRTVREHAEKLRNDETLWVFSTLPDQ